MGWAIGDGESINVWQDSWLSTSSCEGPIGPPTKDSEFIKVAELFLPNERDWDAGKVQALLPHLKDKILSIKPSKKGGPDKQIWVKKTSGEYSTKTGYYAALEAKRNEAPMTIVMDHQWLKNVWMLTIPPKLKLFLWKMKHGALPVNRRLQILSISPSAKCTFCDAEETILHLFFHCQFARQVWEMAPFAGTFDTFSAENVDAGLTLVFRQLPLPPSGISITQLGPWILWAIWNARNQRIFQERFVTIEETLIKAITGSREWQNAHDKQRTHLPNPIVQSRPLGEGIFCRSDGAWKPGILAAGTAWSFYTNNGGMITSHSKLISYVNSSLVAEGLALREAMEHALSLGLNRVNFESDSKNLVAAIVNGACFSEIHGIASDITLLSNAFVFFSLRYCNRLSLF